MHSVVRLIGTVGLLRMEGKEREEKDVESVEQCGDVRDGISSCICKALTLQDLGEHRLDGRFGVPFGFEFEGVLGEVILIDGAVVALKVIQDLGDRDVGVTRLFI